MKKSMMQNTILRSLTTISKVCLILPLAVLLVTSCGPKKKVENNTILVSIEPLRYVTEYLVGGNFNVESITPREATPETYAPTVQQIKAIDECLAFVRVGSLGFEKTLESGSDTSYGFSSCHALPRQICSSRQRGKLGDRKSES